MIGGDSIFLTPHIRPIDGHTRLKGVKSIIYMSATLGSPEVLHRSLGSFQPIESVSWYQLPDPKGTIGKRLILPVPINNNRYGLSASTYEYIEVVAKEFKKLLVFTVTEKEASSVRDYLHTKGIDASIYNALPDNLENFYNKSEGVLITGGRYIGLDLPGETCQVGVITRLPLNVDPIDFLDYHVLEDTKFLEEKVAHRMTQALGRLNRAETDASVFFILDKRFFSELTEPKYTKYMPIEIAAQMEVGYTHGVGDTEKSIQVGREFLEGNYTEYGDDISKSYVGLVADFGNRPTNRKVPSWILNEVKGWDMLTNMKNYAAAYGLFASCKDSIAKTKVDEATIAKKDAWWSYMMAVTSYLNLRFQKGGSEATLKVKSALKHAMDRGKNQWFSDIAMVINELENKGEEKGQFTSVQIKQNEEVVRRWIDFCTDNKKGSKEALEELLESLENGTHSQVCDALRNILSLMGLDASRPPGEGMPDLEAFCLTPEESFVATVEVKTAESNGRVNKSDVAQAKDYKSVYEARFEHQKILSMLFTNRPEIDPLAVTHAKGSLNIIRPSALKTLFQNYIPIILDSANIENTYDNRVAYATKVPDRRGLLEIMKPREDVVIQ